MRTADAGDAEFETFYRAEMDALTRWLTSKLGDPADVADVTQIAFTQLWRYWRQVGKPRSYLYQVARHELARIWLDRRDTRRCPASGSSAGQIADDISARLQVFTVRQRLLVLPGRQRAVLAGYYDGYRGPELAAALNMPATTVRSNHRHAREQLDKLSAVLEQDPRGLMLQRAYADMRDGDPRPPGSRPVIAESWARSAARLADPSHGPAVPPLTGEDLAVRRTATPLAGIAPAACADLARNTGLLTVVTDAEGWVLWRSGQSKDLHRGDHDGHGDGACLAEHAVGTSGVSLALAAIHPVAVCGAEHYCPGQHDLVCVGAPLRHPADGQLLGSICLSARWPAAHPDMLKIIDQTARRIQQRLANHLTNVPSPPGRRQR